MLLKWELVKLNKTPPLSDVALTGGYPRNCKPSLEGCLYFNTCSLNVKIASNRLGLFRSLFCYMYLNLWFRFYDGHLGLWLGWLFLVLKLFCGCVVTRKPWPCGISLEYKRINDSADRLVWLAYVLHNRAVFGIRNTSLLESLFRLIPGELAQVRHCCLLANQKRGYQKGGRYPRWVILVLEDGIALVGRVLEGLALMEEAYTKQNWALIEEVVVFVYEDVMKIQRLVQSGPPPEVEAVDTVDVVEIEIEVLTEDGWQRFEN